MFSVSCAAWVLAILYLASGAWNLYHLMNPLARIDLTEYPPDHLINPYWNPDDELQMKVYISHNKEFTLDFLMADGATSAKEEEGEEDFAEKKKKKAPAVLLWDEIISQGTHSLSKVLVLEKRCEDDVCQQKNFGLNHTVANDWFLPQKDKESLLAGSIILKAVSHMGALLGLETSASEVEDVPIVTTIPVNAPIWDTLLSNRTVYVHSVLIRGGAVSSSQLSLKEHMAAFSQKARDSNIILDTIKMVKHDSPRPQKPKRILFNDVMYLIEKHLLGTVHPLTPAPWDLAKSQPEAYFEYQKSTLHKKKGVDYPYWKPELSILTVSLTAPHPMEYAGLLPTIQLPRGVNKRLHPSGYAYLPPTHVDEIGLTSEKYVPLNHTISALPLRLSFSSDLLSPQRWRLLRNFEEALENQKSLGFDEEDIDDIRRLIADTNVTLLAITVVASVLHLLFEFLTFKSDVEFWQENTDVTGLSIRALFMDVICQFIILLYLIDKGSSLLVTVPSGIGVLIAMWKCQRGSGLAIQRNKGEGINLYIGLEIVARRLKKNKPDANDKRPDKEKTLEELSIETDRLATLYIGSLLLPLIIAYAVYALAMEEHSGWYSYVVTTLSSAVYAVGFVFMTPQLFLNYKLRSVAHLPWKVMCYKFLNTFIDDLFAFIIRMPTMARISCFRDDVVFFVYLYQRWLYPVDESRPVEGSAGKTLKDEEKPKGKEKGE